MEHSYEATDELAEAKEWFERAFAAQRQGDVETALILYRKSIGIRPSAEAYTYMGWTYSSRGEYQRAIDVCMKAIEVDPSFGNPYNDIGAYLIEMGRYEESLPWLKRATRATRYDCAYYPWYNMGKVFEKLGRLIPARDAYARALSMYRGNPLASKALIRVLGTLN